jgi:hypothetical protein
MKENLGDLGVDGRIILKRILEKQGIVCELNSYEL